MFYILVSRLPFIYNITNKNDKMFKTIFIGSLCYIILHGLLYSKKFSDNVIICKYRNYLMYLSIIDIALTTSIVYFLDNQKSIDETNNNDASDIDNEENTKLNRDEILQKYYKTKNSPFINKAEAEEINNNLKKESFDNNNSNIQTKETTVNVNNKSNENSNNNSIDKNNNTNNNIKDNDKYEENNDTSDEDENDDENDNELTMSVNSQNNNETTLHVESDTEIPLYK